METSSSEPEGMGDTGSSGDNASFTNSPLPANVPLPPSPSDSQSSDTRNFENHNQSILMTPIDEKFLKSAPTLTQPSKISKCSPRKNAKKLRKKTLLFKSPKVIEYKLKIAKLEREVCFFQNYIEEIKNNCRVEILDECERNKNSLSAKFKEHIDTHSSNIEALHNRIVVLENSEKTLTKQIIPTLKGRVAALEKTNNNLLEKINKLEVQKRVYSTDSIENTAEETCNDSLNDYNHNDSDPRDHRHTPDLTQSPRSSSGHSDTEHMRDTGSDEASPMRHEESIKAARPDHQTTMPASQHSGGDPEDNGRRISARAHMQPTGPQQYKEEDKQSGHPSPKDVRHMNGDSPAEIPYQNGEASDTMNERKRILNFEIKDNATHILIGDSTIKGVNPHKSIPHHRWSKTCIGGLRTMEIPELLHGSHNYPEVKEVFLHTGVSDSKSGPLSTKSCSDTLKHIMYKFPSANINVSSIIPTKGKDSLSESVKETNTNMKTACKKLNIKFINNETIFLSRNGAPKLALYNDKIHPSRKGTAVLANNIFDSPNHETRYNSHYQEFNQNSPNFTSDPNVNPPPVNLTDQFPPLSSSSRQIRNGPIEACNPRQAPHLERQYHHAVHRQVPQINHYDPRLHTLPPMYDESLAPSHVHYRESNPYINHFPTMNNQQRFHIQPQQYHPLPFHPPNRPFPLFLPPQQPLDYQSIPVY